MAAHGRRTLRDLFDESPTPHIAHPPDTHHRDFYLATDGSYRQTEWGGLGAVIETRDGHRVARVARTDAVPNNNVAEYRALHLGLDVLATRVPPGASVGVLVDHDDLAANLNAAVLAGRDPNRNPFQPVSVPPTVGHHWRGVRARVARLGAVRAAVVDGTRNPAHPLANDPTRYAHVNDRAGRCVLPEAPEPTGSEVPPPSRADRNAGD